MKTNIGVKGKVNIKIIDKFGHTIKEYKRKNIFTTTGKDWLSKHMGYSSYAPLTQLRADCIKYIGAGSGTQPQVASVSSLVQPISYDGTNFLAELNLPTAVNVGEIEFTRVFSSTELSVNNTVNLTEFGLFTDGSPGQNYQPGTRNRLQANALAQAPVAYVTIDPIAKSQDFSIEIQWTLICG